MPTKIPSNMVMEKSRMAGPPNAMRATSTASVDSEVSKVRGKVELMASLMISLRSSLGAVEYHDGIVDRISCYGEEGANVDDTQLGAHEHDQPKNGQHIVRGGNQGSHGERPLETHGQVDGDANQSCQKGPTCRAEEGGTQRGAHFIN